MAIEAFASEGEQERSSDVGMRAQHVHHAVCIRIRVATTKADQMNRLTSERVNDLAGYMVSAFHKVGDNDTVADSFSSIRAKEALQCGRVI
jgi:hypothetical protein